MTDNNTRDANEAANANKGENIVHIARNGADELQRIKRSGNSNYDSVRIKSYSFQRLSGQT